MIMSRHPCSKKGLFDIVRDGNAAIRPARAQSPADAGPRHGRENQGGESRHAAQAGTVFPMPLGQHNSFRHIDFLLLSRCPIGVGRVG
jgi:hypothetical protein